MRDILYIIVFFVIAGLIGYGLDSIFSSLLPASASGTFINTFKIGIRPLSFSANLCGVIGVICSYALIKIIFRK